MAKLSEKEAAALKRLQEKAEAPDAPSVGRSINVNVDLSDPKQIALAIKHGFLTPDEVDELEEEETGNGEEGEETPRRKGFFGDA